jgi:hypothetical protein
VRRIVAAGSMILALGLVTFAATEGNADTGPATSSVQP